MGTITNSSTPNGPLDVIAVVGFSSFKEAALYVQQDFNPNNLNPVEPYDLNLGTGSTTEFNEDPASPPFVVFCSKGSQDSQTLLSIVQCYVDQALKVEANGKQMLLTT